MSSKHEPKRLRDIVDNIDRIARHLEGQTFSSFSVDELRVDAVERCLERVAEAVVKIGTDRMREVAPMVPVEWVRGLGNLLRHAYDEIDLQQIYILIGKDLPPLRDAALRAIEHHAR